MKQIIFPASVSHEKDLYGRENELRTLRNSLRPGETNPAIILGERRIGKTSLMLVLTNHFLEERQDTCAVIRVEARSVATLDQLASAILAQLATRLGADLNQTGLLDSNNCLHLQAIEQFEQAVKALTKQQNLQHILLTIDEIDAVVRAARDYDAQNQPQAPELPRILGLLNALAENHLDIPVSFLLTLTTRQEEMEILESLIRKSVLVELGPLSREDHARMLCDLTELPLSAAETGWFYEQTAGHPYITKLILDNLGKKLAGAQLLDQNILADALEDSIVDERARLAFSNLYDTQFDTAEKRLVLMLASSRGALSETEIAHAGNPIFKAARRLVRRNYLIKNDQDYHFKPHYFALWLQEWEEFDVEMDRLSIPRNHGPVCH